MGTIMYLGVRIFIAAIFVVIGGSFVATTGVLAWEFWHLDWLGIAAFYSHLFVFFPTLGLVVLVAFFLPACVFLDMYWRYIPFGRARFILGLIVIAGLSFAIALIMRQSTERSIFEITPRTLTADKGAGCRPDGHCDRLPVLAAVSNVRKVSQQRMGLSDLSRNCEADPLREDPTERLRVRRFCFASTPYSDKASRITDGECCVAQKSMLTAINALHEQPAQRSLTGIVAAELLPFKVFFLLMMLVISSMLAFRRKQLEMHYAPYLPGIERGVLIGAGALVILPIMAQAFLQSANLILGSETPGGFRSMAPLISFGFGAFALLLLFFFYRRRDKELQSIARIGGVVGSAVAIIKYEQIIDVFVRVFGSGAGWTNLVILVALAIAAIAALFIQTTREMTVPLDPETMTDYTLNIIDRNMPR